MKISDAKPPVSQALILICEKCGKKLAHDPDNNPSRALHSALKDEIKDRGAKGVVRAVISSCMDVCPDGEITVAISRSAEAGGGDQFYTVKGGDVKEQRDAILKLANEQRPR